MFKSKLFLAILAITANLSFSQSNFEKIDQIALSAPKSVSGETEKLAAYLTGQASSELEKVRAFYVWIAANINYDMNLFLSGDRSTKITPEDVLRRKKTVCQGYAELFQALCKQSSIPCYIVTGYSKGYGFDAGKKLSQTDHAWNAVKIDGKFFLTDVTWGAGVINHKGKYERKFNEAYFLSKPENFVYSHLPADPMWQLLPNPISPDVFRKDSAEIKKALKNENWFSYADTIAVFETLPAPLQEVNSAERAFRYNPINYDITGFAYLAYAFYLSQDMPNPNVDKEAFIKKQKEVLRMNEKAVEMFKKSHSPQSKNGLKVSKQNVKIIKQNLSQF